MGFEEPHLRLMFSLVEPGFPRIYHVSALAAHQGGLVLWYGLGRPVVTSKVGSWLVFVLFGWRFVFGIIMRWDGREPAPADAITTLGNNKVASLLLLRSAKVSGTKDLLDRPTCQGILLCLHLVTSQ